jgi:hypothetical protein
MSVEVWCRQPDNYIKECVEVGMTNIAFNYGTLRRRNVDPWKFCDLYFGSMPWRALVISEDKTIEIDRLHSTESPKATYPVWEYGFKWQKLESLVTNPVEGQEHRVVIIRPPNGATSVGKAFYRILTELQSENPDCLIYLHGLYSYKLMFGLGYREVDVDPRFVAHKGRIVLPTGKQIRYEVAQDHSHWITLLGYKPVDLKVPRNRCMYNIKSALWAADHFMENVKFRTKGFSHIDPDDPLTKVPRSHSIMVRRMTAQEGDKFLCDMCSLQVACKYYRQGAICIVPESEPVELARFFKTRDADSVIDGLSTLMATQTRRLQKALDSEEADEKLHPETTKIINTLFDRGVKLAKLLDPRLASAGAPKLTQINTSITASNPQELMAEIVDMFVQRGIPRSEITPAMIMKVIETPDDLKQRAIDVASNEADESNESKTA